LLGSFGNTGILEKPELVGFEESKINNTDGIKEAQRLSTEKEENLRRTTPDTENFNREELTGPEKEGHKASLTLSDAEQCSRLNEVMAPSEKEKERLESLQELLRRPGGAGMLPYRQVMDPLSPFYRGVCAGFDNEVRYWYHKKFLEVQGRPPKGKDHRDIYRVLMVLYAYEKGITSAAFIAVDHNTISVEATYETETKSREEMVALVDKVLSEPGSWDTLEVTLKERSSRE